MNEVKYVIVSEEELRQLIYYCLPEGEVESNIDNFLKDKQPIEEIKNEMSIDFVHRIIEPNIKIYISRKGK